MKSIDFRSLLKERFPKMLLGLGYGSAFSYQQNHEYNTETAFDLLFVVEDTRKWHSENLQRNRRDYSGLSKYLGAGYISFLNKSVFPIHFNPFVQIDEQTRIKYGVLGVEAALDDLRNWSFVSFAGRLHKPIQIFEENDENLIEAYRKNLRAALAVSLLLNYKSVIPEDEIFFALASISYIGDVRFSLKGEKANKVKSIIEGNIDGLRKLYLPLLKEAPFKGGVTHSDGFFHLKQDLHLKNGLVSLIPYKIGEIFSGVYSDFDRLYLHMKEKDQPKILITSLDDINKKSSRQMLLYNMLALSPSHNIRYALSKMRKARAAEEKKEEGEEEVNEEEKKR